MPEPDYPRIAYEAYVATVTDKPRLRWEFLAPHIRRAWEAAIDAAFNAQIPGDIPKSKAKCGSKAGY